MKFRKLNEAELENRTEEIWSFLQTVHPELIKSKEYSSSYTAFGVSPWDIAIELRALRRDGIGNPMYCSHRIYNYSLEQRNSLKNFLVKLNKKEIPFCLYYSVYNFNSSILAISQSGNVAKKWNNRIATNNAVSTHIVVMDFDHITEQKFLEQKKKLQELGIETLDVFSGHGYQSIILLQKLSNDKELLGKFTDMMLEKGFDVDIKIKDCPRIMRPPGPDNSKDVKDGGEIIPTYIYNFTDKRYKIEDIFEKINTLPTIREENETTNKAKTVSTSNISTPQITKNIETENQIISKIDKDSLTDAELENLYKILDINSLPEAIKLMLSGFQKGYANSVLMFLTLYFKEQGHAKTVIINIINILKDLNTYNYPWTNLNSQSEVNRFFYNTKYNSSAVFFSELTCFGEIQYNFKNKEIVFIDNYVFNKLKDISKSAFYIYIKLLIKQNLDGTSVFTVEEMANIVGISKRSILQHIGDLVKIKIINKKRAYKKNGEEYKFFISVFKRKSDLGFTKFNIATLKLLTTYVEFKKINTTQLALCMYIKHICYNGKEECSITQENLGIAMAITQGAISKSFKNLEDINLIKRNKEKIFDFQFKYNYTIHF